MYRHSNLTSLQDNEREEVTYFKQAIIQMESNQPTIRIDNANLQKEKCITAQMN